MSKELKNKYGIKIGDIFYMTSPCGRHGRFINFFQVVALKGTSKIIIREIERKEVSHNGKEGDFVVPNIDHFLEKSAYVEYNEIGAVKIIKQDYDNNTAIIINTFYNRSPYDDSYFKHSMFDYAYLWAGKPLLHYIDYMD